MTKEELETEAEEKYFNHKMADFQGFYNYHYYYLGYIESAELREKRIAELEKENDELKKFVNAPHTKGRKTTRADYIKTVWDLSKQLTKSKELLKWALHSDPEHNEDFDQKWEEAEQFLKQE